MSVQADKYKLGLFILAVLAVLLAVVLALGSGRMFSRKLRLVTSFDHSVQGLEIGSAVKYRGVQVGRVEDISLAKAGESIRVDITVNTEKFKLEGLESEHIDHTQFTQLFQQAVSKGLRASLNLTGITGMKCVEFDYVAAAGEIAAPEIQVDADLIYVPSHASGLMQLEESVTETAARIAEVDFAAISAELKSLLGTANAFLQDPRLQSAFSDLSATVQSLRTVAKKLDAVLDETMLDKTSEIVGNLTELSDDLRKVSGRVAGTLEGETLQTAVADIVYSAAKMRSLIEKVDRELGTLDIQGTAKDVRTAFQEAGQAAQVVSGMHADLNRGLHELDRTLRGIRRLADYLQENPSAIVRGKPE